MTREVVTMEPGTSAKDAARFLVEHGFAALPVVDEGTRLIGIVAEADVLRDRLPQDPRPHLGGTSLPRCPPSARMTSVGPGARGL